VLGSEPQVDVATAKFDVRVSTNSIIVKSIEVERHVVGVFESFAFFIEPQSHSANDVQQAFQFMASHRRRDVEYRLVVHHDSDRRPSEAAGEILLDVPQTTYHVINLLNLLAPSSRKNTPIKVVGDYVT